MTNTTIEMSEDEFDDQHTLLTNHLNPNATWVCGDGPGCLFETYDEELEFVRQQDPSTVWTLVDGDDGDQYLLSGYHFVNRIGYLVSMVAVPEGVDIEVRIPMQTDPSEESAEPESVPIHPDHRLAEIAREKLGIPTLETRRSDRLDFYDVSAWQVEALKAAFDVGTGVTCTRPEPDRDLPTRFDAYEIHGLRRLNGIPGGEDEPEGIALENCEPVEDAHAEFWSLFGHIPGQGLECIGDFATRQQAEEVFARITGRPYAEQVRNPRSYQP